jgi:hypothetical protein
MDPQLEFRVVARMHDLDVDGVRVIHDAARHVHGQVAKLPIDFVGLARRWTLARRLGRPGVFDYVAWGSDDSRCPASQNVISHRADKRSVGRAELSLWTTSALTERAAPTTHIRITAVFH